MNLGKIIDDIKKHMKENSIEKENAAINIPGRTQRRLIDISSEDDISYLLNGREGQVKYKYFEPIIEEENGKTLCTYILYV